MSESLLSTPTEGQANDQGQAGGAPAGQAAAPVSGSQGGTPSWRDSLPETIRGDASIAKFNKVDDLAQSYLHLQKMVGAEKIPVPGKNATEADWQQVYRKLGLPESVDKYEVKAPEGADPAFLKAFKEEAHKRGILPQQAQAMLDMVTKTTTEQAQAAQKQQLEAKQAEIQKGIEGLKSEWGQGWEKKVQAAKAAVDTFGGDDLKAYLNQTGLGNDPAMIKLMAKIGEALAEDKFRGEGSGSLGMTPAEAKAKIDTVMGDMSHPFFNDSHPGHKAAVDEMQKLYGFAARK